MPIQPPKPTPRRVIVLCGPPGVGKFSIARILADRTKFKLFHNHLMVDLLESLFEFGSRPFVELRERYWLDALTRAADEGVEGVLFTLAFDKTLSPAFPGRLDEALRDRKVSVLFVELACAPKVLESRIVSPERTRYGKLISIDRYRELESTGSFIRLSLPAGTASIDTTNLSVEATAEKIYQLIS